jgi:hypothetical protein
VAPLADVIVVALLVLDAVTASLARQSALGGIDKGVQFLACLPLGVIVAWHQPRNPMGWALLSIPDPAEPVTRAVTAPRSLRKIFTRRPGTCFPGGSRASSPRFGQSRYFVICMGAF